MKNLYISAGLIFALLCVNQIWAQDDESEPTELVTEQVTIADTEKSPTLESSVKINLALDNDEMSDQESLQRLTTIIRGVAGEEAAQEVIVEVEGMTEEEKTELAEKIRQGFDVSSSDVTKVIGVVMILMVVLVISPVAIIIMVSMSGARKRRQKMDLVQAYLDAGKEVPPQVLNTFGNGGGSLRSGLMLTAIGIGIVAAFNAANNSSVGALGLIPMFIGLAKLLYWFFEERKYNKAYNSNYGND